MTTTFARKEDVDSGEIARHWYIVDAEGQTLGRLATRIADVLRGRHKPLYTPHVDIGDFVIVVNADKVAVTGHKRTDKMYRHYTGHPGGLKEMTFEEVVARDSRRIITQAVEGMLPKNRLSRRQITKLKVYRDGAHPHAAQKPEPLPR